MIDSGGLFDEKNSVRVQKLCDHSLIFLFWFLFQIRHSFSQVLQNISEIIELSAWVCFGDQEGSSSINVFFDCIPIGKTVDKVEDSFLEVFSSAGEVMLVDGQHKFQLGGFAEGSIVEVSIGKHSMKSVGVSIARLIDHFNCFELSRNCIFLSNLSLEDIGNLCFRVSGISNFGTEKEIGAGSEGEFSFLRLSPEG